MINGETSVTVTASPAEVLDFVGDLSPETREGCREASR